MYGQMNNRWRDGGAEHNCNPCLNEMICPDAYFWSSSQVTLYVRWKQKFFWNFICWTYTYWYHSLKVLCMNNYSSASYIVRSFDQVSTSTGVRGCSNCQLWAQDCSTSHRPLALLSRIYLNHLWKEQIKVLIIKSKFLSGDFLDVLMPMCVLALEFIKMLMQVMKGTGFNCKCKGQLSRYHQIIVTFQLKPSRTVILTVQDCFSILFSSHTYFACWFIACHPHNTPAIV